MQTGECTSRAVGWKEVAPRAGSEASMGSLDGLGPTAPVLDQGWRGRDVASSATPDAPRASASLIYLDPRTFTREGMGRWLQSQLSGFRVCALPDPEQIMAVPAAGDETRAVIINTGPERMASAGVASLIARVGELAPSVPVAVLSDYEDADNVRAAFELGVRGYIPTSLPSGVAVQAVQLVCAGGTFAPAAALLSPPEARNGSDGAPPINGFTQRQAQILDCLRRGMANKLIAYELNMCESTVKVHIRNIMKKLNATNRTQVVYLTNGLFENADHYR
jgi:DNA-binding NarL/FixJ family response regulator